MHRSSIVALSSLLIALGSSAAHAFLPPTHETVFSKSLAGQPYITKSMDAYGFGAGYTTSGSLTYQKALTSNYADIMRTSGSFSAWAMMFDTKHDVVRITGSGFNNRAGTQYFDLTAYARYWGPIVGMPDGWQQAYTKRWTSTVSIPSVTLATNFFYTSVGMWVGPIPVTVSARATGYFGWSGSGSVSTSGINVTFTPKAGVEAVLSAGPDIYFASAGVRGVLNLISARLPVTSKLWMRTFCSAPTPSSLGLSFILNAYLDVDVLGGWLELYAEGLGQSVSRTIGTWDSPWSKQVSLLDLNSTWCF